MEKKHAWVFSRIRSTLGEPPFPHNDQMSTARPEYPGLIEDLIRYMDLNHIDRTVLIQCMYHGYDNSYMCDGLRRFPDRLHGVALIDPLQAAAAEQLQRLHQEHGVQGMRLYPITHKDASWLAEFLREILAFPAGRHDDQVDALSQFLAWTSTDRPPMFGLVGSKIIRA